MTNPTVSIRHRDNSAEVDTIGATLVDLRFDGERVISGPTRAMPDLGHHGAVLAPWPNRLNHGRYSFGGETHQLPINDPAFGHAIHGLVYDREWRVVDCTRSAVTMGYDLEASVGYPFPLLLSVSYRVDATGLHCDATWTNRGGSVAPFGIGFHPYFRPGPSPISEWTLRVPATRVRDTDPMTKLPTAAESVTAGSVRDFRISRALGESRSSRAYELLHGQETTTVLSDPRGWTLSITASGQFRWMQVFSGHLPSAEFSRRGLAIEPQTCAPNAFATGEDVIALAPGETGGASWSVSGARSS